MKKISFTKLVRSIVLIAIVSTFLSFALSGGDALVYAFKIAAIFLAAGFIKGMLGINTPTRAGVLYEDGLVINDTTYAGEAASYMLTRAVVGSDTVQKGVVHVQDGIKKKYTIPRVEVADFMQRRAATPTSKGTMTVDAASLEPKDVMLYTEFNPRDFEAHWFATQLEPRLLDATLPPTAENFVMLQQMKRLNEWFETAWHQSRIQYDPEGDNVDPATKGAPASGSPLYDSDGTVSMYYWDGFIKKALADSNTIEVPSAVALTSSNIRDKWSLAIDTYVPKALLFRYGGMGLKIVCSYADKNKYEEALRTDTYKNIDSTETAANRYRGYDVVPCAGIPENTFYVVIARPDTESNMWVGINSVDDNTLQLQRLQNNSELYFIKGLFKADTTFGFYDQLVLYTVQTN